MVYVSGVYKCVCDCGLRVFCSQGIQQGRYILACIEVCMAFQYVPVHNILSRRRRSVKALKPRESVQYNPKADNQVTSQTTTGEFCCVSSNSL